MRPGPEDLGDGTPTHRTASALSLRWEGAGHDPGGAQGQSGWSLVLELEGEERKSHRQVSQRSSGCGEELGFVSECDGSRGIWWIVERCHERDKPGSEKRGSWGEGVLPPSR